VALSLTFAIDSIDANETGTNKLPVTWIGIRLKGGDIPADLLGRPAASAGRPRGSAGGTCRGASQARGRLLPTRIHEIIEEWLLQVPGLTP